MQVQNLVGFLQGRLTTQDERGFQFFPNHTGEWEREFKMAKEVGADCIELLIETRKDLYDQNHPLASQENMKRLREVITETGIAVHSVHAFFECDEAYKEELKAIVSRAADVGAHMVLVPLFDERAIEADAVRIGIADFVRPGALEAAKRGLAIGIETEMPAGHIVAFADSVGAGEAVGINYDIGNAYACGLPVLEEIRMFCNRIVGVHVKDRTRLPDGGPGVTVPLGTGSADISEALQALRAGGYAKPFIIQGARQPGRVDSEVVKEYIQFVRTLINEPA